MRSKLPEVADSKRIVLRRYRMQRNLGLGAIIVVTVLALLSTVLPALAPQQQSAQNLIVLGVIPNADSPESARGTHFSSQKLPLAIQPLFAPPYGGAIEAQPFGPLVLQDWSGGFKPADEVTDSTPAIGSAEIKSRSDWGYLVHSEHTSGYSHRIITERAGRQFHTYEFNCRCGHQHKLRPGPAENFVLADPEAAAREYAASDCHECLRAAQELAK